MKVKKKSRYKESTTTWMYSLLTDESDQAERTNFFERSILLAIHYLFLNDTLVCTPQSGNSNKFVHFCFIIQQDTHTTKL